MVYYVKQGRMPRTRHTFDGRKKLLREELFGEESFDGSYSLLYHRYEPTRIRSIREVEKRNIVYKLQETHKLVDTELVKREGDFVTGRKSLFGNEHLTISILKPARPSNTYFRHGVSDQLFYVRKGKGVLKSMMGDLSFETGDYIYVPKGTTYTLDYSEDSEFLLIESKDNISIPQKYLNKYGQLKEGVPYYSRDIRHPVLNTKNHGNGTYEVYVDFDEKYIVETRTEDPFDLEGWDGYHYPFALNVKDIMPLVGKIHQPPPVHETFSSNSFMVGTFLPRKYDFHDRAIPISYYHSNVDTDEFLYYASGNFMSRKGVRAGSMTLHVRGMIHGPQPGTVENAIGKEETNETAIMVESYARIGMSSEAEGLEIKNYMKTWYE
ncbi:MAG: homogentisate 1,2-dioxygenase [Candidatus Thermoplasmatota archaeon]|nr:homogentisate 1,2-dioxygenase [Candidatus Thermoplasmatota archaeon]MCL6002216.1 homogentisate 1,2-dioxygenase [Candidatus Thermoplasmatota archaeon]